ncbi:MAG: hypothetical protein JNJ78_04775 [Anaerolineae bacterium]|nr:hypothetical protein [Anaerolineae bacterium]
MSYEDDTPFNTGDFAANYCLANEETGELAANYLGLAFLGIHFSVDASSNLVIGDLISI